MMLFFRGHSFLLFSNSIAYHTARTRFQIRLGVGFRPTIGTNDVLEQPPRRGFESAAWV